MAIEIISGACVMKPTKTQKDGSRGLPGKLMLEVQGEWRAQGGHRGSVPSPHAFPVHPVHLAAPKLDPCRINWSYNEKCYFSLCSPSQADLIISLSQV